MAGIPGLPLTSSETLGQSLNCLWLQFPHLVAVRVNFGEVTLTVPGTWSALNKYLLNKNDCTSPWPFIEGLEVMVGSHGIVKDKKQLQIKCPMIFQPVPLAMYPFLVFSHPRLWGPPGNFAISFLSPFNSLAPVWASLSLPFQNSKFL